MVASFATRAGAATRHPQLTDPAGDAKDALGINHPAIDILSSDVSTLRANLVFTLRVANLSGVDLSSSRKYFQALSWGSTNAFAEATGPGSAIFSDFVGDSGVFGITGTSTFDTAKNTVTMTFSLAAINAGGPDHFGVGTQTFLGNTVTAATPLVPALQGAQVVDAIQPPPTSYIVGQ